MEPISSGNLQLLRWGHSAWLRTTRRLRADHKSIARRDFRLASAVMQEYYVYAAVAPSRWSERPVDDRAVQRARNLVDAAFPKMLPPEPVRSDAAVTVFAREHPGYRVRDRSVSVHRTGLVEVLWQVPVEENLAEERTSLLAVPLLMPVLALAHAVNSRHYAEISKLGRGRRRFGRVDWLLGATANKSTGSGSKPWTGIEFPTGVAPPPRATDNHAWMPPEGYGAETLWGLRRSTPPEEIGQVFLRELLTANGYYDFTTAVDHTAAIAASSLGDPA